MVTVTIDEDTLLELLLNRVRFWTSDETTINLYEDYCRGLVDSGCFENCKLDIKSIVDNDYIVNLTIITKEEFEDWDIESEGDDRIEAFNKVSNLYLIRG